MTDKPLDLFWFIPVSGVIGRVRDVRLGRNDAALIYWRGDYERLGWMADEVDTALGLRAI
jgi:hypothetical protein